MATSAFHAHGTQLKKGSTAIVEVKRITGPNMSADAIDVTNMDSTSKWREFVQGLRNGGEISAEGNYLPADATHTAVFTDLGDGSSDTYNLVFSDSGTTTITVSCIVIGLEPRANVDGAAEWTFRLKVTGVPSIA